MYTIPLLGTAAVRRSPSAPAGEEENSKTPKMWSLLPSREQLHTLLHLVAWCQVGVLLRIQLDALFGGACAAGADAYGWAPCVTSSSGALLNDLPPNMVGSFIMGALASSDVLAKHLGHTLAAEAPLALLPRRSSLQVHTSLQVGLRTGLCGSLTTFSSWMLQVVVMLVGAHPLTTSHWVEAIWALALNVWVCMAALVTGQHACLAAYHRLNPGAFLPRGEYCWRGVDTRVVARSHRAAALAARSAASAASAASGGGPGSLHALSGGGGGDKVVVIEDRRRSSGSVSGRRAGRTPSATARPGAVDVAQALARSWSSQPGGVAAVAAADGLGGGGGDAALTVAAAPGDGRHHHLAGAASLTRASVTLSVVSAGTAGAGVGAPPSPNSVAAAATAAAAPDVVVLEEDDVGYPLGWAVADALAACTLVALTGVGIWWAAAWDEGSSSPFAQKSYGIALLFGPAGCLLRFYLSRFNGSLKGRWAWLPAGTFAANMVACAVNFSLRAGIDTTRHMPFAIEALLAGIMTGFSGSLSTVSTWVVELQLLLLTFPARRRGYVYLAMSMAGGLVLGVAILGSATWWLRR